MVAAACGGCATQRQIAKLYSELNGARLDVEMVRAGDEVRADARVRNGWINMMTLWDPFGNSYRPTSVKAARKKSAPKFSVGIGSVFGGDRDDGHHEGFEDSGDNGYGVGIEVPVGSRDKPGDRKTFTFDVPQAGGPEYGGWQISCDVTTKDGNTPVFPFEVPATSTPEDPIYIDYAEKCECCPNLRLCVDVYVITDPDAAPGPQFSPLNDKFTLKRIDKMVSIASKTWEKACIYIEVCQVFVLDPKKIKIPGGGKTLADYMDSEEVYSIKKTINGRDFLGAAGEYVKANKKKHHKCPFGNTNCLKLFIVNAGGPGGKHGGGSVVDMSQVDRPHPTMLAHEFGHDMMGDVKGKNDGHGHTKDGKNLMYPKIDGAGSKLEDWQKKRAQDEVKRRGLQNPESDADVKKRASKIWEEIETLTGEIATAEAAKAAAEAKKPEPDKPKKKHRKRKKKSVKDQIDEVERRIKTNETARDNADDDVYKRAHQRAIDRLKARLKPLKKRLPKPDKPKPAGDTKPPAAAGVGKDFDLDKAKERLDKLKKEYRRLCCDETKGKAI
jgi:hypothetical protein